MSLVVQLPWALISAESDTAISTSDTSAGDLRSSVVLGISECIPPTPSVSFAPISSSHNDQCIYTHSVG